MDTPQIQQDNGVSIFLFITGWLIFSGCSGINSTQSPYLPPTSANPSTLQPTTLITTPLPFFTLQPQPPTQTEICSDNLLYIEDITIPDWTSLKPGSAVDKQWKVENNGTCDWDDRYSLRLTSGDGLGIEPEQGLYPARAGSQAIIHIYFTAPLQAGTVQSVWQAFNFQGQPFGDPISILVVVEP